MKVNQMLLIRLHALAYSICQENVTALFAIPGNGQMIAYWDLSRHNLSLGL
jgi:hypothetical protein